MLRVKACLAQQLLLVFSCLYPTLVQAQVENQAEACGYQTSYAYEGTFSGANVFDDAALLGGGFEIDKITRVVIYVGYARALFEVPRVSSVPFHRFFRLQAACARIGCTSVSDAEYFRRSRTP